MIFIIILLSFTCNCSFLNRETLRAFSVRGTDLKTISHFFAHDNLQEDMIFLEELHKFFTPPPISYLDELQNLFSVTGRLSLTELYDLRKAIVSHSLILESFKNLCHLKEIRLLLGSIDVNYQKGLYEKLSRKRTFDGLNLEVYENLDTSRVPFQAKYLNNDRKNEPYIIPLIRSEFLRGLLAFNINQSIIKQTSSDSIFLRISNKEFNRILALSVKTFNNGLLPDGAKLSSLTGKWESTRNSFSLPTLKNSYLGEILSIFVGSAMFGQIPSMPPEFSPSQANESFFKHFCMIVKQIKAHQRRRQEYQGLDSHLNGIIGSVIYSSSDLLVRIGTILSNVYSLNFDITHTLIYSLQVEIDSLRKFPSELESYPVFEFRMPEFATFNFNSLFCGRVEFGVLLSLILEQKMFELMASYFTTPLRIAHVFKDTSLFLKNISNNFVFGTFNFEIVLSQFKFLYYTLIKHGRAFDFGEYGGQIMVKWGFYIMTLIDIEPKDIRKELLDDLVSEISYLYPDILNLMGLK